MNEHLEVASVLPANLETPLLPNERGARFSWKQSSLGDFSSINNDWQQFTGQTFLEYAGKGWLSAVHEEDRDALVADIRDAASSDLPFQRVVRVFNGESGDFRFVSHFAIPDMVDGGWNLGIVDVHDKELLRQNEQKKANESAIASELTLEFVTHELKNMLFSARNLPRHLMRNWQQFSEDKINELLEQIQSESARGLDLVQDILLWRKIKTGQQPEVEPLVAAPFLRTIVGEFNINNNREIDIEIGPETDIFEGNPALLNRVLVNLLGNAAKYSDEGTPIKLSARKVADHIIFAVGDQGVGISEENQKKLFQPFVRVGASAQKAPGTGIGLMLCKEFVEVQGGHIWVESDQGVGSTFSFSLPVDVWLTTDEGPGDFTESLES